MRFITASFGGRTIEFPASNNVLRRAEMFAGVSTPTAVANGFSAAFVQGIVAAGLETVDGRVTPDKMESYFESIGEQLEWGDMDDLYHVIMVALVPELVSDPNAPPPNREARRAKGKPGQD